MGAVVDVELVVAVDGELLEPDHEPLEDRLRLEGDDAVDVALVPRGHHGAVDRDGDAGEEALLVSVTQFAHGNWNRMES